jgi:hypothetical protein
VSPDENHVATLALDDVDARAEADVRCVARAGRVCRVIVVAVVVRIVVVVVDIVVDIIVTVDARTSDGRHYRVR